MRGPETMRGSGGRAGCSVRFGLGEPLARCLSFVKIIELTKPYCRAVQWRVAQWLGRCLELAGSTIASNGKGEPSLHARPCR